MEEEPVKKARLRAEEVLALLLYTGIRKSSRALATSARLTGDVGQVRCTPSTTRCCGLGRQARATSWPLPSTAS
eukprot:604082-Hanusia_phi.AAC.1